jgi:uncharacterized protein YggE
MRTILLLTACCLATACQPAARDARGVDHDETLLTVSATGRADTRPDEARIQLGVRSQGKSASSERSTISPGRARRVGNRRGMAALPRRSG